MCERKEGGWGETDRQRQKERKRGTEREREGERERERGREGERERKRERERESLMCFVQIIGKGMYSTQCEKHHSSVQKKEVKKQGWGGKTPAYKKERKNKKNIYCLRYLALLHTVKNIQPPYTINAHTVSSNYALWDVYMFFPPKPKPLGIYL